MVRIFFPRQEYGTEGEVMEGLYRGIERIGDKYQMKISVPDLSKLQNLYIEFDESDIESFLEGLKDEYDGWKLGSPKKVD